MRDFSAAQPTQNRLAVPAKEYAGAVSS